MSAVGCTCPAGTYDYPNAVHTDYCQLTTGLCLRCKEVAPAEDSFGYCRACLQILRRDTEQETA